jgi:hypothetical protein
MVDLNDYVTAAEAAQILNKTVGMIGRLCRSGKFPNAEKKGTAAWLIPRDSVLNYVPGPRGPKPQKAKLAAEKAAILKQVKETGKEETA